tara:strand:+ start:171 stop:890 length:720 start_codon:yes stop_codon:yes gene_type:complete
MPDISYELEGIATEYAEKIEVAKDEVITTFHAALKDMTPEERMVTMGSVDMNAIMTAKLSNAALLFEEGIKRSLESTFTTATLSEESLTVLLNQTRSRLSVEITQHISNDMVDAIIEGMANNKFPSQIIKELNLKMPKHQAETLINTIYNQFNNSVTNQLASEGQDNTRFIYIGAWDSVTRDECVERIKMSPATRKEIQNSRFGNMNNAIWNCRHKWEEMSDKPFAQGLEKEQELDDAR